jgi:class 3 adenylate cyclase
VGIATGQVVAGEDQFPLVSIIVYSTTNISNFVTGVLGSKRYLFDMWGDAVNTAARMEQHGLPGQIQVTKEVVEKAGRGFHFECRGQLAIKGKGVMETYLLKYSKDTEKRRSMQQSVMPPATPAVRSNSDFGLYPMQDSL